MFSFIVFPTINNQASWYRGIVVAIFFWCAVALRILSSCFSLFHRISYSSFILTM